MNEMIGNTHVIAEGTQIHIERRFDAPRALVFAAWTKAEHLMQWWGPREYPTTYCTVDFRVGGKWHYCMTGPAGDQSWGISVYQEIIVPERIVYTDAFSNAEGTTNPDMPAFSIAVDFIEDGTGTRIVSVSHVGSEADVKQLLEMGMAQGVAETWDRLAEMLQRQTA